MRLLLSVALALSFSLPTLATPPLPSCAVFVSYEGVGGPEPTRLECAQTKTMAACKKSCTAIVKKNCPDGMPEFQGSVNFNSASGFEVDTVRGKCAKKK